MTNPHDLLSARNRNELRRKLGTATAQGLINAFDQLTEEVENLRRRIDQFDKRMEPNEEEQSQ